MPLSPEQKKALRVAKILDKGEFAMVEELDIIDTEIETIKGDITLTKEELTAKVDEALVIANETQKMEGKQGEQGIKGEKGDKGKDGLNGKDGKNGLNGIDGQDGKDGIDGKDGVDGISGKDGLNGSPDTGEQIIEKINLNNTILIDAEKVDLEPFERRFSAFKKDVLNIPRGGGAVGGSSGSASPLTTKGDIYGYSTADARIPVGTDGEVLTADSTNALGVSWQPTASSAVLTYMFANIVSDIGATYLQAVSINSYVVGTKSSQSGTATTSGVTIGRFATNSGFPNVTLIPAGTITIHYDTEKSAGSNNYYSYAQVYKRNLAGTETLLATSDNSPQTAANTQQSVTVTAILASDTSLLSTDRIVVKVVVVMASSTATVFVYGDDATGARIELPTAQIDATNYVTISTDQSINGTKTFLKAGIGTTVTDAIIFSNTTTATNGNQQVSPAEHFSGRGYSTGGAGSSQSIDFRRYLLPVQGASGATGRLITQISRNGASYSDIFTQSTTGEIVQTVLSGVSATTGYEMTANFANSDTQTTQHMKFSNAGTNTWLTFYFATVQKGAFGVDSSGVMRFYGSGNRYIFHSGVTGSTGIAEIYSGGFYNTGGNFNSGRVTAGSNTTSPPSTLTNYGSTSLYTTVITSPTTLDDSMTQVIVDCSTYNVCSGTPSTTDCGTYTGSGQATCESHLPCVWYAGDSCSAFNNESGMGTCSGTSGCSADTSSCAPYNSDQTTCEAADDAYGGSCTWSAGSNTCPAQDCSTCAGAGCTPNLGGDCSAFSDGGGDGTACMAAPCGACSYDSGSGVCSGNYFTSCDGDNTTPSCSGSFYTGNCSGTYNISCSGTVTCSGYPDSSACAGEAGCSWTSGVTITMPASPVFKTYWIAKDYTSGQLTILPNSGQTVNNTTSITSSSTAGVSWMLSWVDSKSNWYIMSKH